MALERLEIRDFRNIESATLEPGPGFNIVAGANASGKTSLLEALFVLSRGRSFRATRLETVIRHGALGFSVFGRVSPQPGEPAARVAFGRAGGMSTVRVRERPAAALAELTRLVPLQLIHPGSHELLEGGPRYRRRFLNWGLFHVEPSFHAVWGRYQRVLKQRNAQLRSGAADGVGVWDRELVRWGETLASLHEAYCERFVAPLARYSSYLLGEACEIGMHYRGGWPRDQGLIETLDRSRDRDRELGYTTRGPHRADVDLRSGGLPVLQSLSRGQLKLLVIALYLAQAADLLEQRGVGCTFAFDDLPAELDATHRARLLELLAGLTVQVFASTTDASLLPVGRCFPAPDRMFHVEHGAVTTTPTAG